MSKLEIPSIDKISEHTKNNREEATQRHAFQGWAEYVHQFCDTNPGTQIAPGVFVIYTFSFELYLSQDFKSHFYRDLADKNNMDPLEWYIQNQLPGTYGTCDSPEQFLESDVFRQYQERPEEFVVTLIELRRDDPQNSGWRWHKNGPYIGTKKPQYEYLRDEIDIESIYAYQIYLKQ